MTHFIFNRTTGILKGYDARSGALVFSCPAANYTIESPKGLPLFFGHDGACPNGAYELGTPEANDPPVDSMGAWFIPLVDVHHLWDAAGRADIGIHAGRGGPEWVTLGCIRIGASDLTKLAALVVAGDRLDVL